MATLHKWLLSHHAVRCCGQQNESCYVAESQGLLIRRWQGCHALLLLLLL
jgi:hypothetical protein